MSIKKAAMIIVAFFIFGSRIYFRILQEKGCSAVPKWQTEWPFFFVQLRRSPQIPLEEKGFLFDKYSLNSSSSLQATSCPAQFEHTSPAHFFYRCKVIRRD
jgi:hypothetical protein